jgi:hypothetical protein
LRLDGGQIFIRSGELAAIEQAVRDYVREVGCRSCVRADSDEEDRRLGSRSARDLVLSKPKQGTVTLWEDGVWADRHMAASIARELRVEVIWLMTSEPTDTLAYAIYRGETEIEREQRSTSRLLREGIDFVEQHAPLPFALVYLPDTKESDTYLELKAELEAEGAFEPEDLEADDKDTSEWLELEPDDEAEDDEPSSEEAAPDVPVGELLDWWRRQYDELDAARSTFRELSIDC